MKIEKLYMGKKRIAVLMGGMSIEKEVSFNSGRTICDHLDPALYQAVPLFQTTNNLLYLLPWHFLHRGKISDFEHRLEKEAPEIQWDDLKDLCDFVYIATHGRYAEDGTVQGMLEVLNIPYLGAKVLGSALGMDKTKQKEMLCLAGIPVAQGITLQPYEIKKYKNKQEDLFNYLDKNNLSLPLVVKPNSEGSSLGVSVVKTKDQLFPALEHAYTISPEAEQAVLVEEKLEGMEYSYITLWDKDGNPMPVPPTEIVYEQGTEFHDYTQKYMPGKSQKFTPARLPESLQKKIQETCFKAANILELNTVARFDGFVKKDGTVVLVDPNSLSGMAPSSFIFNQAAEIGMSHTDLINHIIAVDLHSQGIIVRKEKTKSTNKKIRVAVLLGGDTNERETSLDSGRNICYKLSPAKYDVLPLFVDSKRELYPLSPKELVHNATKDIEHSLDRTKKITWHSLPSYADFVFIGLHGGIGENGSVQGTLEMLGLPYNGSGVTASALAMNKYKTNSFLQQKGFVIPHHYLINKNEWKTNKQATLESIIHRMSFPLIAKPDSDGCSVGVCKVTTVNDLEKSIETVFTTGTNNVLIEEYIIGMELTVGIIGNEKAQALPPSQALSKTGILSIEEKFLPGAGENQTPAPLPKKATALVQKTIEQVYEAVGCKGYARIDCFYQTAQESPTQEERVVIIEINNLPGMTPATCIFHQAAEIGIKPMEFVDTIVQLGFKNHQKKHTASTTQKKDTSATLQL